MKIDKEQYYESAKAIWVDFQRACDNAQGIIYGAPTPIFKPIQDCLDDIILHRIALKAIFQINPIYGREGIQTPPASVVAGETLSYAAARGQEQRGGARSELQWKDGGGVDRNKIPPYRVGSDADSY